MVSGHGELFHGETFTPKFDAADKYARDRKLVAALLTRQEGITNTFLTEYSKRVHRFILKRVDGDRFTADDLCQQVMMRATKKLASYRGTATLFTWICQIARHEIADFYRQRGIDMRVFAHAPNSDFRKQVSSVAAADEERPDFRIYDAETRHLLYGALQRLPQSYAAVLTLKYIEELRVSEIAARLGASEISIQSSLARARRAFRETLESAGVAALSDVASSLS